MMDCTTSLPTSAFYSTNLATVVDSYNRLGQRICRALGAPLVNIEVHTDQLNEFIAIACEMYTKYAGYTREYLVFDSDLYEDNKGIRLDVLFSLTKDFNFRNKIKGIPDDVRAMYSIGKMVIGEPDKPYVYQVAGLDDLGRETITLLNSYDYLVRDYRKVISVLDFEEGSSNGVNTLFTIEQTLAQQTYFSYSAGNFGFDLISWYVLKDWLETREKVLALQRDVVFDERTQYMRMVPPPRQGSSSHFYGVVCCYVEKPLMDVIKEPWVYKYALALTKQAVGNVRGKYPNQSYFGGGSISGDFYAQGYEEKEKLEAQLLEGAAPGMGDGTPTSFFIG